MICHHCDNPPCFRISHIYCGTHATNGQDRVNRSVVARLPKEAILIIRHLYAKGKTQSYIAACFGIDDYIVSRIVRGLARPEVGGPLTFKPHWRMRREAATEATL
jgi:hypothetical protein